MQNKIPVKIKKLNFEAKLPDYAHEGDAGLDVYSCEDCIIRAGGRHLVPTGIAIEIPEGYVAFIKDKSGVAYKNGVTHMAGVIEHTYRGEYRILLHNTSNQDFEIKKFQKIAQIVILPVATAEIQEVGELSETKRGDGAFGSTGVH